MRKNDFKCYVFIGIIINVILSIFICDYINDPEISNDKFVVTKVKDHITHEKCMHYGKILYYDKHRYYEVTLKNNNETKLLKSSYYILRTNEKFDVDDVVIVQKQ